MQQQEWTLMKFKILQITMFKDWKTSAIEKGEGRTSCSKQRGQKTIFCSNTVIFRYSIVLLIAMIIQYL